IMMFFSERINMLTRLKVNDIILDPGFGFSKTVQQNFELMHNINEFKIFQRPVLVGISRKSMIYKTLETSAEQSLNGTTVLNTFALLGGAHLLRVHDVKEAVETVKLLEAIKNGH
ncbi:MAG: dihydropteroate synthase, partial [Tannerellaceae bacterium]